MDKTKKFNWVFVIIVILVLLYFYKVNVYKLNDQINSLQSNIQNMQNGMDNLSYNLQRQNDELQAVKNEVKQSIKISLDEKAIVSSYNQDNKTALIDVSFKLKDYKANDVVKVIAVSSGGATYKADTVKDSSNEFTTKLELPYVDNYILNVEISGDSIRSDKLTNLFLEQRLTRRFSYDISTKQQTVDNAAIRPFFVNAFEGNDKLKIKEIKFNVLGIDKPMDFDLMPYIDGTSDIEGFKYLSLRKPTADFNENLIEFKVKEDIEVETIIQFTDNYGIKYEQKNKLQFYKPNPNNGNYSSSSSSVIGGHSISYDGDYTQAPAPLSTGGYEYIYIVD